MDITMDYEGLKEVYNNMGEIKFMKMFKDLYASYKLYSMSTDWINSSEYILKFRGASGDIIISWE
jgi:hypothetical protein